MRTMSGQFTVNRQSDCSVTAACASPAAGGFFRNLCGLLALTCAFTLAVADGVTVCCTGAAITCATLNGPVAGAFAFTLAN